MTFLRTEVPADRPLLTRVGLSATPLPALPEPWRPWPGREIEIGTQTVHVRETPGPGPDAPRAVYVHGLGGSATNWTELAGQLSGEVTGIAVDLPGFGRSRPPSGGLTLPALAETVTAVIHELGDGPVHLLGNSMGGSIALLVAASRPDLVRTLTLISPAMPDFRPSVRRMSDPRLALAFVPVVGRSARRALAALTPEQRADQLLRLCYAEPDQVSEQRIDLAVTEFHERMAMPWAGPMLGRATVALFRAWLLPRTRSLWSIARQVSVPSLVVWGSEDRLVSVRKAPRTARQLPRGRLLVLPRTGHVAQMERPVTVARAVLGMWEAVHRDEW